MIRAATLSRCGRYRFHLARRWGDGPPTVFVLLNPSTADGMSDDPTVRRVIGFSRSWGWGAAVIVNLYAWRARDPRELAEAADPVGPGNDEYLECAAQAANREGAPLVAAWGARARPERVEKVLALPGMDQAVTLGLTRNGHPRHPLYLRADTQLEAFPAPAGC